MKFEGQSQDSLNLNDLRGMSRKDESVNLLDVLKGRKMTIDWPNKRPQSDGSARARIVHDRIRMNARQSAIDHLPRGKILEISDVYALFGSLILIPPALFVLFRMISIPFEKAIKYSAVGTLILFFAELGLVMIRLWKKGKVEELQVSRKKSKVE